MPKFLFVYREQSDASHDLSPEAMQQAMQQWMDWIERGHAEGWMVSGGDALLPEGRVVHASHEVTDGPFIESKEIVAGYSIIQADHLDDACEHAQSCPMLTVGGKVEIRPLAEVGPPDAT